MTCEKKVRCLPALANLKELHNLMEEDEKRRKPKFWVNPFLEKRENHSLEAHLLKDILWEDGENYKNFCRMSIQKFEEILSLVDPIIKRSDTTMRYAVSSRIRLAITLRYLATGDSFRSLEYLARVSQKTISKFLPVVLEGIIEVLEGEFMTTPTTESEWYTVANDFDTLWQFPHTLGAIDGKHIRIKAPPNSGSDFYNYKGFFSIVLLAVVDAHSRFLYVDIGANGRASDVVIYKNSSLYDALTTGKLHIPPDKPLKGQTLKPPYFFIGDDIFGLNRNLMKAYNRNSNLSTSQEVLNYRLSRARMTVEMAFGRLTSRFRIFHRPIEVAVERCDVLVKACCILHNYLSRKLVEPQKPQQDYSPPNLPTTMSCLQIQTQDIYKHASQMRDNVRKYCVTDGDFSYQWNKIKKQVATI